ncbi:MAG: hypothetical protein WDW36_005139 [Sanguina aurantia]
MAPRINVPIREIVYQLSPYQQDVIKNTFKNAPATFVKFMKDKGPRYALTAAIYYSCKWATLDGMHHERMKERF